MTDWLQRLEEDQPERNVAIEELRTVLARGLRAGLSGRVGSNHAFIEDIVQVSLLRCLDQRHTFQGRGSFTSWALAIAIRMAFNEIRRREWGHVSLEQLREQQGWLPEETDGGLGPERATERRETAALLRLIIETDLTDRQREALLGELNGMPQEEIARQLKTNRNNIYKLFHDARKALKRALLNRGFEFRQGSLIGQGSDGWR